ncbi:MAG: DUF4230 domain-containing protein [Slackia sp.]|nr:DUF4230 domain-containing protein [Slackia sp.]
MKIRYLAIGIAAGALIGSGGLLFFQNYNPQDENSDLASTVFGRIVERNELVSVSQDYCIVDKAVDTNRLFDLFDIPFSENSFWYRYEGTLKAGVNLEHAEFTQNGTALTISLETPYIISNTPNMDESGVLEERGNVLNPIHVEDVDEFQRQCIERSHNEAIEDGLLEEAKTNAEENIRSMFNAALGETYTVEFDWKEGPVDENQIR